LSRRPLGIVVAEPEEPNTLSCWAALVNVDAVKKDAFVVIEDAKRDGVKFVGRVVDIINRSMVLKEFTREEMLKFGKRAEEIVEGSLSKPEYFKALAKIRLLYKIDDNGIGLVDTPPVDTSPITGQGLQTLPTVLGLSRDPKTSISLGRLYAHPDVEVSLDLNRLLSGHIAIFGQTYSGKSYAAGVIIEEVVKRGVPVVVFDHMGEYLSMERAVDGGKGLDLIKLVPGSNATMDFEDVMKNSQILTAVGVTDAQLNLLRDAYAEAKSRNHVGLKALEWLLEDVKTTKGEKRKRLYFIGRERGYSSATVDGLRWKLESLLNKGIVGKGFRAEDVIKPGHLTVVDLSNVEPSIRSLAVGAILNKIVESRKRGTIPPLLVVIEEAHNYATSDESPSSVIIRDLIRGARHHGIGVVLVSQRPSGIHRDALNIVNTYIVFRLKGTDLDYIKQFTPFTREELEDIQVLPEGVAYIASPVIRGGLPIKIIIRKRTTVHGGESVKFV
jgi:DNA helicase HerA-like ATPase